MRAINSGVDYVGQAAPDSSFLRLCLQWENDTMLRSDFTIRPDSHTNVSWKSVRKRLVASRIQQAQQANKRRGASPMYHLVSKLKSMLVYSAGNLSLTNWCLSSLALTQASSASQIGITTLLRPPWMRVNRSRSTALSLPHGSVTQMIHFTSEASRNFAQQSGMLRTQMKTGMMWKAWFRIGQASSTSRVLSSWRNGRPMVPNTTHVSLRRKLIER